MVNHRFMLFQTSGNRSMTDDRWSRFLPSTGASELTLDPTYHYQACPFFRFFQRSISITAIHKAAMVFAAGPGCWSLGPFLNTGWPPYAHHTWVGWDRPQGLASCGLPVFFLPFYPISTLQCFGSPDSRLSFSKSDRCYRNTSPLVILNLRKPQRKPQLS